MYYGQWHPILARTASVAAVVITELAPELAARVVAIAVPDANGSKDEGGNEW
jgi:hypothetical protein